MPKRPPRRRRPASGDAWGRILRGLLQAIAGGAAVQIINFIFPGRLDAATAAALGTASAWLAGVLQNMLEEEGIIKPILKGEPAEPEVDALTAAELAAIREALAGRPRPAAEPGG